MLKASLVLNDKDELALFYDEPLGVVPEWASIDIKRGEIFIGGHDIESKGIKLDKIDDSVYERVFRETKILLVRIKKDGEREPLEAVFVPLTVPRQL